jgi:GNAT superfamily N-acetyltransferase
MTDSNTKETPVKIRPVGEVDLSEIYALYREWMEEGITPGVYAAGADALRKYIGPFFLAAEGEGRILGFLLATRQEAEAGQIGPYPQGGPYLEIEELYVRQGRRGEGIGTALMEAFTAVARNHGLEHGLVYSSSRDWRTVIGFYERFGFKFWHVQMFK